MNRRCQLAELSDREFQIILEQGDAARLGACEIFYLEVCRVDFLYPFRQRVAFYGQYGQAQIEWGYWCENLIFGAP